MFLELVILVILLLFLYVQWANNAAIIHRIDGLCAQHNSLQQQLDEAFTKLPPSNPTNDDLGTIKQYIESLDKSPQSQFNPDILKEIKSLTEAQRQETKALVDEIKKLFLKQSDLDDIMAAFENAETKILANDVEDNPKEMKTPSNTNSNIQSVKSPKPFLFGKKKG